MHTLYLRNVNFGDDGVAALVERLERNTQLKILSLSENKANGQSSTWQWIWHNHHDSRAAPPPQIGESGAASLARLLQRSTPLSHLYLHHNAIGSSGALMVAGSSAVTDALQIVC